MAYENMNGGFNWDDVIENDSSFILLPEGIYPYTITNFTRARHDGSANLPACNKAILEISVNGGTLGKTTITHNLFLHQRTEGLLCEFFTSIGARKHGERLQMNWDKVVGATGQCSVEVNEYVNKNGENRKNNRIKRFIEPSSSPAPAPSGWQPGKF